MRCCTGTIAETDKPSLVGDKLECSYCSAGVMVVALDGVWEWDQPATFERYGSGVAKN